MKKLIAIAILFAGFEASAALVKVAECTGVTDQNQAARVVLFADNAVENLGFITVNIQGQSDFASAATVDWHTNPQGFPRFFNNDFDLDIVISNTTKSMDDILVGNEYVSRLLCGYDPSFTK